MSKAIVDPAELRRFAQALKSFNAQLHTQLYSMHAKLVALGSTWRDSEHDKFTQEFEQTMQILERFMDAANEHVPFLLRKAERIEDYLQQR